MEEFVIGKLSVTDISEVISLGLQTEEFQTGTDSAQFTSKETLEGWINDDNGVTLAAKVADELVGYVLGYYLQGPNDGYLNFLIVKQEYRGLGVGSNLLEKAIDEFKNKYGGRCDHIFSLVKPDNEATLRLFEKYGFQIGETFNYVEKMI